MFSEPIRITNTMQKAEPNNIMCETKKTMVSRLGRTNLVVPSCGFGGIPIGRDHLTDDHACDLVRRAIDAGMTLIDTYSGYGRSEIRIGQALKGSREKVTLVTKSRAEYDPEIFEEMIETSFRNLDVECIDILLLKNLDTDRHLENMRPNADVLRKLAAKGKIKFIGISSHSPEYALRAIETGLIDVAEVPYNYANPFFEKVLDLAAQRDVGILTMKPFGGGRVFADVEKGAAETTGVIVNALSFAMSHPSNPVVIPGIGSEDELNRYLEAIPRLRRLSAEEKRSLTESASDFGNDFCRACGYCRSVCPTGIPIDEILPLLDRFKHVRTDDTYRAILKSTFMSLKDNVAACEECNKCIEECPYDLPIPQRLREALDTLGSG